MMRARFVATALITSQAFSLHLLTCFGNRTIKHGHVTLVVTSVGAEHHRN